MPDPNASTSADPLFSQEAASNGAQSSWFGKAKLLLFAVAVVVAECVIAYLLIPTAADASAMAGPREGEPGKAETLPEPALLENEPAVQQVEVDLGQFGVTSFQPSTNSTLLIDFHLYGTVSVEDRDAFAQAMEMNQHRFRDQVIVIVRSAELTDLTDAGLGLIKRKILEKSNKLLGRPYLRSIIFSDFSFVEQ